MFGFNNHMLESLFNIFGGIATLYASIGYIVSVIFSKIMFDILGVKPILALVPFYNTYRIYKEYKGRVWKRNWGVAYILTFIFPAGIITGVVLNLTSYKVNNEVVFNFMLLFLVSIIIVFICFLIINVFGVIMLFIMYLPIFDTKVRKVVLNIQAALTLLTIFGTSIFIEIDPNFNTVRLVMIQMIFSVVFTIVYLLAAREVRARIRSGEYVLQEKLDYETMDSFEINETLKARKRRLVVPIISNELNYNVIENNDMK
ncbi:hypothetical protein PNO30_06165 [Gemella haemolysans]|uniref:DUF624 domain-containing protein n=1 Tax=Gemella haemolysans TaxID=1379 RepID=A0AAW6B469_9BACL|nr:hypothetical protein [Gemella haemolysans]MDB6186353.1 hypothetical protein [Gemella haemolysans]MDB6212343.1 hypothetical protein [Gemella haemolysans]